MLKYFLPTFCFLFFGYFYNSWANNSLLSFKSQYDLILVDSEIKPNVGKTYVTQAEGELFVDWLYNCDSWVSNQRMVTKFINNYGVGTVNEINYSLVEMINGEKIDFSLEIKENAEPISRTFGKAMKDREMIVEFQLPEEGSITFEDDVIFPHQFLKEMLSSIENNKQILSRKVYDGTIPKKFFNISAFFTQKKVFGSKKILSEKISNDFNVVRMAFYQDNLETPIFELTQHVNQQGVVNYFKYDYPEYSLEMKLRKVDVIDVKCN